MTPQPWHSQFSSLQPQPSPLLSPCCQILHRVLVRPGWRIRRVCTGAEHTSEGTRAVTGPAVLVVSRMSVLHFVFLLSRLCSGYEVSIYNPPLPRPLFCRSISTRRHTRRRRRSPARRPRRPPRRPRRTAPVGAPPPPSRVRVESLWSRLGLGLGRVRYVMLAAS